MLRFVLPPRPTRSSVGVEAIAKAPGLGEGDALHQRLLRVFTDVENELRPLIISILEGLVDRQSLARIVSAFETGSLTAVQNAIDFSTLGASLNSQLGPVLSRALERGGEIALERLPGNVFAEFSVLDPQVTSFLTTRAATVFTEMAANTEAAVRDIAASAFQRGIGSRAAAREIRSVIGLTSTQARSVSNFRASLIQMVESDGTAAALGNQFNLARGLVNNRNMTLGNVDRLTDGFRDRFISFRAEVIARTESVTAVSAGRHLAWEQFVRQGAINREKDLMFWMVTPDERLSVLGSKSQVLTSEGWRAISKVQTGELVMTHLDRYREVVGTTKYTHSGPAVRINLPGRTMNRLTLTYGHQVWVERAGEMQWVESEKLQETDLLSVAGKPCAGCGETIASGPVGRADYCPRCAQKISNKARWDDPEQHERLTRKNQERWSDPEARRSQAAHMREMWTDPGYRANYRASMTKYLKGGQGPASFTPEENKVAGFLESQGIVFERQWPWEYTGQFGWADIFVPGAKLVIEVDHKWHLDDPRHVERDTRQGAALESAGFDVIRLQNRHINAHFDEVASEIRSRLCFVKMVPLSIEHITTRQPAYDIQVYEDESFVVAGVAVHNCPICEPIPGDNSEGVKVGDTFSTPAGELEFPPAHPQCLPGDTLVTPRGRITAATKRWVDDDLVVIQCADALPLSCTPNHPVFTRDGWVPAHEIQVGDEIANPLFGDRVASCGWHNIDVPSRAEDIAEAFFDSLSVTPRPVPVAAPDFHGDGVQSEIAIIGTDWLLRNGDVPELVEHGSKVNLNLRYMALVFIPGLRALAERFLTALNSACRIVGRLNLVGAFGGGHTNPLDPFGSGPSAYSNTALAEPLGYHAPIDTEQRTDGVRALTAKVQSRDLVFRKVDTCGHRAYSGWVYNFETTESYYIANGYATHNCRCDTRIERGKR